LAEIPKTTFKEEILFFFLKFRPPAESLPSARHFDPFLTGFW
jgi:hypothetical protein